MGDVESGAIDVIVIYKIDRLSLNEMLDGIADLEKRLNAAEDTATAA